MDETGTTSLKRRLSATGSNEDLEASSKIKIIKNNPRAESLLDFSDEILIEICKHLDHKTLLNLGCSCKRFENFVSDKNFWINLDFSLTPTRDKDIQNKILPRLNSKVKSIKIRGMLSKYPLDIWKNLTVTSSLLFKIQEECPMLEYLSFTESAVDIQKLKITDFPHTLKILEFSDSESLSSRKTYESFFNKVSTHLDNLEVLKLDKVRWFEIHDFIAFSKIPKLKHLSLKGCDNLKGCVPYCSISARFGFKTLEILDFRDTPISDSDVQCFNCTDSLRELYLECPRQYRKSYNKNEEPESEKTVRRIIFPEQEIPINPRYVIVINESRGLRNIEGNPNAIEQNINLEGNNNVIQVHAQIQNGEGDAPIGIEVNNRNEHEEIVAPNADPLNNNDVAEVVDDNNPVAEEPNQLSRQFFVGDAAAAVFQANFARLSYVRSSNARASSGCAPRARASVVRSSTERPSFSVQPPFALISDTALLSFGIPKKYVSPGIVIIRAVNRAAETNIEILHLRHYKLVTDITLVHLSDCAPKLKILDVTGTEVTISGVTSFKILKPNCKVISDFN